MSSAKKQQERERKKQEELNQQTTDPAQEVEKIREMLAKLTAT